CDRLSEQNCQNGQLHFTPPQKLGGGFSNPPPTRMFFLLLVSLLGWKSPFF
ncbi:hypothetical protein AVDCRST_MAG84-1546, partial [uncultured Microcoleus sp.]